MELYRSVKHEITRSKSKDPGLVHIVEKKQGIAGFFVEKVGTCCRVRVVTGDGDGDCWAETAMTRWRSGAGETTTAGREQARRVLRA